MTNITCRLTAKNRDLLRNLTLGNRVWAPFFVQQQKNRQTEACCIRATLCGKGNEEREIKGPREDARKVDKNEKKWEAMGKQGRKWKEKGQSGNEKGEG